jgi:aspartyl-tRNA(Asn)/glutamyl-tRNA(Gln) amidotransferase subunit A
VIDWAGLQARNALLNAFVDFDQRAVGGTGSLGGLKIGVKANLAVKDLPWTAGTEFRRHILADDDAVAVKRLRAAGATILGTLNMEEAALGAVTDNPWYGRTFNPHQAGFTPGGSSGGSAAAVAAGLCDAALGTDTLGSIRIPAAYCGVYGLKPTHRSVLDRGLFALDARFDVIGPLARSLDALSAVWSVLEPAQPEPASQPRKTLFLLSGLGDVEVQPAVDAAYARAATGLAATGLPVEALSFADSLTDIRRAALAEVARSLHKALSKSAQRAQISPALSAILEAGIRLPKRPTVLRRTRALCREALVDAGGWLLLPTAPQVAFAHGSRAPSNQADFTCLASIAGFPALAMPSGRDARGLPTSVQIVGPPHSEMELIAVARRLDTVLNAYFPPPNF